MKLRLNNHLVILLVTLALHQTNFCMDTLVSLAIVNTKNTTECGTVTIKIQPDSENEDSIAHKILLAYNALRVAAPGSLPAIIKITQANRVRTPLDQLIREGLAVHKHLVLRALLQAQ